MKSLRNAKLKALHAIARTRRHFLGPHVVALLIDSKNGQFLVDADDMSVGRKLAYSGDYGSEELARLYDVITSESRVLVVGTHVGTLAIAVSRRCSQLTAIEANPRTVGLLELNVLINGCKNVETIHIAASDKREELEFVMSRTNSGGSKRAPAVRDFAYFYDSPEIVRVPAAPLDDILAGQPFDVILMDIEGSEYFALKGMTTILTGAKDLFVEFVPHHLKNVSCVTVSDFVATISPYFSQLHIPSKDLQVGNDGFLPALQRLYDAGESDDGLHFSKTKARVVGYSSFVASSISRDTPYHGKSRAQS